MPNHFQAHHSSRLLSPRELAMAIGVSESSLKRWVDEGLLAAGRTAGKHRRISQAEAIRFIRQNRTPLLRPELLGFKELDSITADLVNSDGQFHATTGDQLFKTLADGKQVESRGLILRCYLGGMSIAEIADGPLQQAMSRIGDLWQHKPEGVFIEHRATDICIRAVNQLRLLLEVAADAPRAVGGAPSGDPYLLPSLLAACVLAECGFDSINLGPNTPNLSLVHAALHHSAQICWLSVSSAGNPNQSVIIVRDLSEQLSRIGVLLIVGGRESAPIHITPNDNLRFGESMAVLSDLARAAFIAHADRQSPSTAPTNAGPNPIPPLTA